jgi:hypothetical protein
MDQSARYKQSLIKSIQREWTALMAVVERLSPQRMLTPDAGGWSPKDNLAHLTMWLKALVGHHIDHKSAIEVLGIPAELDGKFDFNAVNAYMYAQNKDRSSEDILAELKAEYAGVLGRLDAISLSELMQPRHPDDPRKEPLVIWVLGNTSEHFAEHRAAIEKMLEWQPPANANK